MLDADDLEAMPVTPTVVLERLDAGESANDIVTHLIGDAMAVSEGHAPADLVTLVAAVIARAERMDDVMPADLLDRITPLDPTRPAADLLEDLLCGIHGCWLIYHEFFLEGEDNDLDDDVDEDEDVIAERWAARSLASFAALVRVEFADQQAG